MTEALNNLGLTLNTDKTRIIDAMHEGFTFLGFTIQIKKSPRTGKTFPLVVPSKKAMGRIKKEIEDTALVNRMAGEVEISGLERYYESSP
jgi:RNA-directed DNA polymerase